MVKQVWSEKPDLSLLLEVFNSIKSTRDTRISEIFDGIKKSLREKQEKGKIQSFESSKESLIITFNDGSVFSKEWWEILSLWGLSRLSRI